jgi:ABC-2 type transport system permease protein
VAQVRAEVLMTLRRGETLLLTVGIPVAFEIFFSEVHAFSVGVHPAVDFVAPGILALAVMSTSMVSLGIATGFERGYGVLKRLGATPLGRPRLLVAKLAAVGVVELLQVAVLVGVGLAIGWHPGHVLSAAGSTASHSVAGQSADPGSALALIVLGTVAFGGIGLLMAGTLRAELNLAAANGLYIVLLLLGGMLLPLDRYPGWLRHVAEVLPAAALADGLHRALGSGTGVATSDWVVLVVWAVAAPVAAALTWKWE